VFVWIKGWCTISLLSMYQKDVTKDIEDESFLKVFWMQQLKESAMKSKCSIQWHPLIIRWALYLSHRSSGAYETLRKSAWSLVASIIPYIKRLQAPIMHIIYRLWYYCWHPATWSFWKASKTTTHSKICFHTDRWSICERRPSVQQIYWIIDWLCWPGWYIAADQRLWKKVGFWLPK